MSRENVEVVLAALSPGASDFYPPGRLIGGTLLVVDPGDGQEVER
jgi:hypothetical protein